MHYSYTSHTWQQLQQMSHRTGTTLHHCLHDISKYTQLHHMSCILKNITLHIKIHYTLNKEEQPPNGVVYSALFTRVHAAITTPFIKHSMLTTVIPLYNWTTVNTYGSTLIYRKCITAVTTITFTPPPIDHRPDDPLIHFFSDHT